MNLPITDPVLIFALVMAVFLVIPPLFERLGVPGMIGLILAGVLVGPHGVGFLAEDFTLLSALGLLYLIFLAALELDLNRFLEFRRRSIVFGLISFFIPMGLALAVMPLLGYGLAAALLTGAIIGSHTLLAYPIASRLGIVKNTAMVAVVGGTIITDTLALTVLAIVAGSVEGEMSAAFLLGLLASLGIYATAVLWGVPRLGRWFFRHIPSQAPSEFIFLLCVLFGVAFLAGLAGAEPIIGAFLAGLTLNRLIPRNSALMTRVRFVGNTLFIPFFILSVGMLVNPAVLVEGTDVWVVAAALVVMVHLGKFAGAWGTKMIFGYSRAEALSMFGLSVPQAAATLAVTFVGLEVGLFGDVMLNAVVIMILVTVFVGPAVLERYGRQTALEEIQKPYDPTEAPQRILIPISNPATADALLDIAFILRGEDSEEPLFPLMVVREEGVAAEAAVAEAERVLGHAVIYAAGADVPVTPLTRVDPNIADGIVRGMAETRTSTVVVGWDGRRGGRHGIFGSVLDQLLSRTEQLVVVAKMGHPLNTTRRIVLVVPPASDHHPGFYGAGRVVKTLASELGAQLNVLVVRETPEVYERRFERIKPEAPMHFQPIPGWRDLLGTLRTMLQPEDLVVVLSARRGTVAWHRELEGLPGQLADLVPESFLIMYPAETATGIAMSRAERSLPQALAPERILLSLPRMPYQEAVRQILATGLGERPAAFREAQRKIIRAEEQFSSEILPGVILPHAQIDALDEPLMFLATAPDGIPFPNAREPATLVFVLLTPAGSRREHLELLTDVASMLRHSDRLEEFRAASSKADLYDWFASASV